VDCWIGVATAEGRRVVRVAGRLSVAHVPELLLACAEAGQLEIDLTDLVSADVAGIDALRRVQSNGAALVAIPGYIQMKLEARSD
jgi:hypothetical protein